MNIEQQLELAVNYYFNKCTPLEKYLIEADLIKFNKIVDFIDAYKFHFDYRLRIEFNRPYRDESLKSFEILSDIFNKIIFPEKVESLPNFDNFDVEKLNNFPHRKIIDLIILPVNPAAEEKIENFLIFLKNINIL